MSGTGVSTNPHNEIGRENYWDREAMYDQFGITEYIEVEFNTTVYISNIEILEVSATSKETSHRRDGR